MHYKQRTVAKSVKCSGVGIHSGKNVNLTIRPAPPNHGLKFIRTDLPDCPEISAHFNMVVDTSMATVLGYNGFIVSTIEHLMASFAGLSIDNALVEVDSYEVPIMDGSAWPFVSLINSGGVKEQDAYRCFFVIKKPIAIKQGDKSVCIYPSPTYKITCTIEFDHCLIETQSYSIQLSDRVFEDEICRARTFGFLKEYEYLKQYGLAKGVSLDNVVVVGNDKVLNDGGLRYPNEFVKHKILDCIGDFALLGMPVLGHVVIHKSGHAFNHSFLKEFFAQKASWETRTFNDIDSLSSFPVKALAI